MAPTTTTTGRKPSAERILELDGLRGLAILLVVLCHYITAVPHGRSHSLGSMAGTAMGLAASGVGSFLHSFGLLDWRNITGFHGISKLLPDLLSPAILQNLPRVLFVDRLVCGDFAGESRFRLQTSVLGILDVSSKIIPGTGQHRGMWFGVMWSLGVEEQFYLLAPPLIQNTQQEHTTGN